MGICQVLAAYAAAFKVDAVNKTGQKMEGGGGGGLRKCEDEGGSSLYGPNNSVK